MNAVLADLYLQTGDSRWLAVAQRFDHAVVRDPLAAGQDRLNGLHANTQVPKWIGAAREYRATGTTRCRDIESNAWDITVGAHTYVIGGIGEAEHFRSPTAIAEACNTYNMLKLIRELWLLDPSRAVLAGPRWRHLQRGDRPRRHRGGLRRLTDPGPNRRGAPPGPRPPGPVPPSGKELPCP
jgi:DUF1680 family protein